MSQNIFMQALVYIVLLSCCSTTNAKTEPSQKPRVLISTDIGGTDPDDNQSLAHLLMYSDCFDIEGIVSSPSFGSGSVTEILRMIDLYAEDYPRLHSHARGLVAPDSLRRICRQGRHGLAPFRGYDTPTEGSQMIVDRARAKSDRPLWVLVWGTLEDVAQALHDAPDIKSRIRVYYIGGPNKKWGVNSYAYIAEHHPDLWMIENNATYRGLITDNKLSDRYNTGYYDYAIKDAGRLGRDFAAYYKGVVKMGDTPSLLYMMDGDPDTPEKECWGGRFVPISRSARRIFDRQLTLRDTVPVYSVMELRFHGPHSHATADSVCFTITIDRQDWPGYYIGNGIYAVRYSPKSPARLTYTIASSIAALNGSSGEFVVGTEWPGAPSATDYLLGEHWYTDSPDPTLYEGRWQGAQSIRRWRTEILDDWATRWQWLRE